MLRINVFISMLIVLTAIYLGGSYCKLHCKQRINITRVLDGDTVEISNILNNGTKVRLIGIDCCELSPINRAYKQAYLITVAEVMKYGRESTQILEKFLQENKKPLYIIPDGLDKYGRTLGIIYAGDTNINEYMVETGHCDVFYP